MRSFSDGVYAHNFNFSLGLQQKKRFGTADFRYFQSQKLYRPIYIIILYIYIYILYLYILYFWSHPFLGGRNYDSLADGRISVLRWNERRSSTCEAHYSLKESMSLNIINHCIETQVVSWRIAMTLHLAEKAVQFCSSVVCRSQPPPGGNSVE